MLLPKCQLKKGWTSGHTYQKMAVEEARNQKSVLSQGRAHQFVAQRQMVNS